MTSRRDLIGALAVTGAALAATRAAAAPGTLDLAGLKKEAENACVYHCDFGDPARFSTLLRNMNNHLSVYEFDPFRIKLVIVAHAAGLKFFLADRSGTPWEKDTIDPELFQRFVGLAKFGVEAYLCQITYKTNDIDPAKTHDHPALKFTPSGVVTAATLQSKGFAYLKVG
jgi:uncharacterized protein